MKTLIFYMAAAISSGALLEDAFAQAREASLARPKPKEEVIYHKKDDGGSIMLSNRRTSDEFKVYLVYRFRDILIMNPNLKHPEIVSMAERHAKAYGLDPKLVQAVIEVESGFKSTAVSKAGAEGLMQIMPGTQRDLGVTKPFDPDDNIGGGVKYLRYVVNRFQRLDWALAAYNAGPENVVKHNGVPPFAETQDYVRKVMERYNRLKAQASSGGQAS